MDSSKFRATFLGGHSPSISPVAFAMAIAVPARPATAPRSTSSISCLRSAARPDPLGREDLHAHLAAVVGQRGPIGAGDPRVGQEGLLERGHVGTLEWPGRVMDAPTVKPSMDD